MHRSVGEPQAREAVLETADGSLAAVGRAIVDNPEHAAGLVVGGPGHDLLDQTVKRSDTVMGLAAAEDTGLMDIQSSQVGPGATAVVFVLDPCSQAGPRAQRRMLAAAGLNTGLFISGNHEFIVEEGSAAPTPLIQIEDASRFTGEVGVAREDPTAVIPRANGVLVEPAPNGASRNAGDEAGLTSLLSNVGSTPTRKGEVMGGRQFTGEGLDLNDQFWGGMSGADPDGNAPASRPDAVRRIVCATY